MEASTAIYTIIGNSSYSFQSDLYGHEIELKVSWVFIGIFHASKLGIDCKEWRKTIVDKEILNEILSQNFNPKHMKTGVIGGIPLLECFGLFLFLV